MNVIAGKFKKRTIPVPESHYKNIETTPQKVKGALFSILGEELPDKTFLDLYSCTGQIGLEALSRGVSLCVLNEMDKRKYEFIKKLINEWELTNTSIVTNFHAFKCIHHLYSKKLIFDYIFTDPPFFKKKLEPIQYLKIIEELLKYQILKKGGFLIIQHYSYNLFQKSYDKFSLNETRKYGTNSLSFFRYN